MGFPFEYRKLGDFTYHVLADPLTIKACVMEWILREWEVDHSEAPEEEWTVEWMNLLPKMEFALEILKLDSIHPRADLMNVEDFQTSLKERADEREAGMLRGVSIEPLLVNRNGFELMDGYTRYMVLKRHGQKEVYAYVGFACHCEPSGSNLLELGDCFATPALAGGAREERLAMTLCNREIASGWVSTPWRLDQQPSQ